MSHADLRVIPSQDPEWQGQEAVKWPGLEWKSEAGELEDGVEQEPCKGIYQNAFSCCAENGLSGPRAGAEPQPGGYSIIQARNDGGFPDRLGRDTGEYQESR